MTRKNFLFLVSGLVLVSNFFMACSQFDEDKDGVFGVVEAKSDTIVRRDTVTDKVPMFFDIVGKDTILLDEDGVRTDKRQDRVVAILKAVPAQVTVDADNQWRLREESETKVPSYEWVSGSCSWTYNHGTVATEDSVYAIYKGRKLPLWKPERLRVTQNTLKVSEYGAYGTKADVEYSLTLNGAVLAKAAQVLCTEPGFVDQFLYGKVLEVKHNVGTGTWVNGSLQCTDSVKIGQVWASGIKNIVWKAVHSTNDYDVQITGQTVANLSAVVGQTWTGSQAKFDNLQISINWLKSEFVEKSLPVNMNGTTVEFIDSIGHECVWPVAGGKILSAKKVRVDFVRQGEPTDNLSKEFDVDIKQRTIIDVIYSFWHKDFLKRATVSGKTLTVKCNNGSKFQPKFDDNTLGEVVEGNFVETLNFTIGRPNLVALAAKGKTYSVGSDGKVTIEGQAWSITFGSRTIESITYNGKEYKNDSKVPQCMATPTTIYFCSDCDSVEYTFKHESEIIKGREKISYNSVKTYKIKGSPIHLKWNSVTGTYELTCDNKVIVVEVLMDGSEGNTFELPYTSHNYWTVSGMIGGEITQEQLDAIIGVSVPISSDGKVTILGSSMTFTHSMRADKVTKGDFSYQPAPCEAVATYLTPLSATQGRVDIYHEGQKVGDFHVALGFTIKEEPVIVPVDVPIHILRVDRTHSYKNQHGNYEGTYWNIFGQKADGSYVDLAIREESFNPALSLVANGAYYTADDGAAIMNSGRAVALVWNGSKYLVGTVTSEDGVAAAGYFLKYYWHNQLAYSLGNGTGTHSQGETGYPNAILGSWIQPNADGSWPITIAGNTYNLRGE